MNKSFRKTLLFGIGTYYLTRDRVENFVNDLQKDGELSAQEGKKMVKDFMDRADEYAQKSEDELRRVVKKVVAEIKKAGKKIEDVNEEEIVQKVKNDITSKPKAKTNAKSKQAKVVKKKSTTTKVKSKK